MAFTDATLQLSNAQTVNSTSVASTVVYDVTGAGVGNAPNQIVGGGSTYVFGADIAVGRTIYAWFVVTTAFVLASSTPHLTFEVQSAPPISISNNNEGTYTTLVASAAFTAAQLVKGAQLILPIAPKLMAAGEVMGRFYRAYYLVDTSTFSAGAVDAYISLEPPSGFVSTLYPNNFASGL